MVFEVMVDVLCKCRVSYVRTKFLSFYTEERCTAICFGWFAAVIAASDGVTVHPLVGPGSICFYIKSPHTPLIYRVFSWRRASV